MRGLPKSIIKKYGISKKAWSVYRGRKKSRSRKVTRRKSNPIRRKTRMARRKRSRRYSMTIPLAPIAGLAVGLAKPVSLAMQGNFEGSLHELGKSYTGVGVDGIWYPNDLKKGLLPLVIGLLVHKFIGGWPLNLNRMLARAKVPFIRI